MTENAMEFLNITKKYDNFLLDHISFHLPCGCIMGFIGENGAGKSTAIRIALGGVRPDEGSVKVLGCDNREEAFTGIKEEIGVVADEACFPDCLNPLQVNEVMKRVYGSWREDVFVKYLDRFQLPPEKQFRDFSRGMKGKLSIAAALSHSARLLIMDEPVNGLDPVVREEILEVFNEFTRDERNSILMSSHIVSDLEKICDYVAYLHQGRLMFCEEKDRLLEQYGILHLSREDFEALDPSAVVNGRSTGYGVDALVRRGLAPKGLKMERAGIEDIMIAMGKERGI